MTRAEIEAALREINDDHSTHFPLAESALRWSLRALPVVEAADKWERCEAESDRLWQTEGAWEQPYDDAVVAQEALRAAVREIRGGE